MRISFSTKQPRRVEIVSSPEINSTIEKYERDGYNLESLSEDRTGGFLLVFVFDSISKGPSHAR